MSAKPSDLQAIFDRIEAGNRLRQKELRSLASAVRSQQVTIATGDRAVAIGGSADGAVIVTGDRNVVITGADAEAIREFLEIRPRSEQILLKAVKDEVESRLQQSLHNAVSINLGIENQPRQVQYPWSSDIKIGLKPSEPIPDDWDILQVFDEMQGKLLILGNPGAGKTTIILELARGLISRAEYDATLPIPVLFNLSNLKDNQQSIYDWLIVELKSRPFCHVSEKISQKLFQEKRLIPLLDGLDELRPEFQEPCVEAINHFISNEYSSQYLVVCSRREEYTNYVAQLQLYGAIYLQDLNDEQVRAYLLQTKRVDLWEALQKNKTLLDLLHTPFWLSILVLSEHELKIDNWLTLKSTEELLKWLLNFYIRRMFARHLNNNPYNKQEPTYEESKPWLIWIAQQLSQDFQTEFLIESLQPYHLHDQDLQKKYQLGIKFGISLGIGALFGIFIALLDNLSAGIVASVLFSWTMDEKIEFYQKIQLVENFGWSWSRTKIGMRIMIFALIILAPLFILLFLYIKSESNLLLGFLFLISFLMCLGLGAGFFGYELEDSRTSNQGIWKSAAMSSRFALIGGLFFGIILIVGISINNKIDNWLLLTSGSIMMLGVTIGLNFGGYAVIQHFILRILLYRNGSIPWNYSIFLNYCKERMLLQQVGGRYRFIHRFLQEHFASMPLEQTENKR